MGSFEIKNTRLIQNLLKQFNREHFPENKEQMLAAVESIADRFENLPMYFMKFHGGSDVDDSLDAMEYATYVHDVQHILLDNLQFMISRNSVSYRGGFDKFDMQDITLEKVTVVKMNETQKELVSMWSMIQLFSACFKLSPFIQFRKFATEKNVHVTLVVHPRNESTWYFINLWYCQSITRS